MVALHVANQLAPVPHEEVRTQRVNPGTFDEKQHFYERVVNAHIHPLVRYFFGLGNAAVAARYCHLHPEVDQEAVHQLLDGERSYFRWGGADLIHVATEKGHQKLVVIETNSCPSGQKSMPRLHEDREQAGYRELLSYAFLPLLKRRSLPKGELAVLYDKNPMECSGYAAVLAELTGEPVHLVPYFEGAEEGVRFENGVLHIRSEQGDWTPIRAALRYVTQRPWSRIPAVTRTLIFNPVLVCLAGGRNKLLAAKAYSMFNAEFARTGLKLHMPETLWDVGLREVPLWVRQMGGAAVVKVPYSNAGQGVFTITREEELDAFMALPHTYDRFIVQALIGNHQWSSRSKEGRLFHVGSVPNKKGDIYVSDLRFMVCSGGDGFLPVAVYARRARRPLPTSIPDGQSSWDVLGTNLSVRDKSGTWSTETQRLLLMDSRDYNRLGLGLDHLIEAYIQTAMAVSAIDEMAKNLLTRRGRFRSKLFASLNPDPALVGEIWDPR